jgi:putative DNA methylase
MPVAGESNQGSVCLDTSADVRLIDKGTLSLEASLSGRAERYGRGRTSHTIHVWWARRPHGAMRALVFASLMRSTGGREEQIIRELPFVSSSTSEVLEDAKELLKTQYGYSPKVLDVFGGGGTIAYEAALLGCQAWSLDYNPLSVFIQKANLEFVQDALSQLPMADLIRLVQGSGRRILTKTRERTDDLFPLRAKDNSPGLFGYFWTYRLRCRSCEYAFLLMKRPWLSQKAGRHTALVLSESSREQLVKVGELDHQDMPSSRAWLGTNGTVACPRCRALHKNPSIHECSDCLVAVGELLGKGKSFGPPPAGAIPAEEYLGAREKQLLETYVLQLPRSKLPKWSGIVNAALYGIETHGEFFNKRQRLVLLELIGALLEEQALLQFHHSKEITRCVIATLSALIDQLVDWNCRLSMWISQNEQVGRAFCGPGVPMLWDYVETDPFAGGPANLWDKFGRILAGVGATPHFDNPPKVNLGIAQQLPYEENNFDAVITDPPYYDNIYYNVLADFFYAWKRPVLRTLCPELFDPVQCGEDAELVSSQFRHGKDAHDWYCAQLTQCLQEIARVLKQDGIVSFVFAHSSVAAWEAVVRSFRASGLVLTSAEPLSIERRQRPRAMASEAVNTCIVLVGRKQRRSSELVDFAAVEERVVQSATALGARLKEYGWREEDIGMAVFAQGVVSISNASAVNDVASDAIALRRLGDLINRIIPGFRIRDRKSL